MYICCRWYMFRSHTAHHQGTLLMERLHHYTLVLVPIGTSILLLVSFIGRRPFQYSCLCTVHFSSVLVLYASALRSDLIQSKKNLKNVSNLLQSSRAISRVNVELNTNVSYIPDFPSSG
jgi:hypothetical protein